MSLSVSIKRKLSGFSLDVDFHTDGGSLGILGASGCGKSMTLKCIAGIESPNEGKIIADDNILFDSKARINIKVQKRKVGYLFQNYALFPNMTVTKNIESALDFVKDKKKKREIISNMITMFHLEGIENRYPSQISGGQQQRVALARILSYDPKLLLLDEPFSALDSYLKERIQMEFMEYIKSFSGDIVLVSHSRDEVYNMCEQLLVMEDGKCIISGNTKEIFKNPRILSVAKLTGCRNFSKARKTGKQSVYAEDWDLELNTAKFVEDNISFIGVRTHDFEISEKSRENSFKISINDCIEAPFDMNIIFTKSGVKNKNTLYWTVAKKEYNKSMPKYLMIAPKNILLLHE